MSLIRRHSWQRGQEESRRPGAGTYAACAIGTQSCVRVRIAARSTEDLRASSQEGHSVRASLQGGRSVHANSQVVRSLACEFASQLAVRKTWV